MLPFTFTEYQEQSKQTAIYPNRGRNFVYPILGLVGEAGEVADKVKKVLRDSDGVMTQETKEEIIKELGDTLWYLAQMASELGASLEDVARGNIEKLRSRKERGMLGGSGDNR